MKSLQEQLKIATIKQPASPPLLPKSGNQTVILGIVCNSIIKKLQHYFCIQLLVKQLLSPFLNFLCQFLFLLIEMSPRPPLKEKKVQRIQESTCFSAELDVPALPKNKRVARTPKVSPAGVVLEAFLVFHYSYSI